MEDRAEKVRKAAEHALTQLAAELEAGKSEALRNYLDAMSRFRRYSWNNVLLIASQRPDAMRVAGIHAWNDLGRTVKKGEKGIMIFAPVIVKREDPLPQSETKQQPFQLAGFRTAYVFDLAQTEGKPLPEFAQTTGDPREHLDKLKEFAAQRGIAIEYDPSIAPAMGVSSGGRVRLVPDLPKAEEFAVLAHELAHELLHHKNDAEQLNKTVRETQAEAVAFVVCQAAGLETNHAAADYIALYNGDKKTLAESLASVQETSSRILDHLFPEQALQHVQNPEPQLDSPHHQHSSPVTASVRQHDAKNSEPQEPPTWSR